MTLGERIRQARELKRLSQEDLANQLQVSRQAVSKWENDSSVPQGIHKDMLEKVLDISILDNKTEKIDSQRNKLLNYLGWITAFVIFLFLFGSRYLESPKLKPEILSIEFYDDNQEIVLEDVLWYNSANIESILIQWEGGTPDQIQVFATPTGTDTLSETELLLTKSVLDSDYVELIDGDILKERYMAHVYFQLNFNDAIVTSDVYNIMYDENYIVE